jgi:hypothetical protein
LQLPWNDPSTPAALKAYALDDKYLRTYYRAPKGYIVARDPQGRPYPLLKTAARQMGLWKPAKKPLLSVRDTSALHHAGRAIKKIEKMEKTVKKLMRFKGSSHKHIAPPHGGKKK